MEKSVDKINNEIYKKHKKKLKNRTVKNKKLLICFGAVPGSGKTHISKILEEKYKGIRINTEDIGKIINSLNKKYPHTKKNEHEILDEYLYQFLNFYSSPNGLIILDASIDRRYKAIFLAAADTGFDLFIIKINISKKTIKERIRKRNKKEAKNYFKEMKRWYKEHKLFKDEVITDITINNENKLDLVPLFLRLDKILKKEPLLRK